MAPRQMSTTSNLSRFDSRRSLANLSMAQKQIAPMTTIIKTPIKTEIIPIPFEPHHLPRNQPRRIVVSRVEFKFRSIGPSAGEQLGPSWGVSKWGSRHVDLTDGDMRGSREYRING